MAQQHLSHIGFLRGCEDKKAYRTQHEAENFRFLRYGPRAAKYHSYRCEYCRQWHVGHVPGGGGAPYTRRIQK